jgi:allantoinase
MTAVTGEPRDLVGYGGRPPAGAWPGGARVALSMVLNYEEGAELSIGDGDPTSEPLPGLAVSGGQIREIRNESMFEFGSRVGAWRLMEIFTRHRVPVTWFACGRALERNPPLAAEIARAGHEVCGHGYRWVRYKSLTRAEQREDIKRGIAAIEAMTGRRPVGWFARDYTMETRDVLADVGGFLYDSHSFNDEVPYVVEVRGAPFVVVPYVADTNDLGMNGLPTFSQGHDFLVYLQATLRRLLAERTGSPRLMTVGLHARTSGLPARAQAVDDFLLEATRTEGVWLAHRRDIAAHWLQTHG